MYKKTPPEGNVVNQVVKCIWVSPCIIYMPFTIGERCYAEHIGFQTWVYSFLNDHYTSVPFGKLKSVSQSSSVLLLNH